MGDRKSSIPASQTISGDQLWQWQQKAQADTITRGISPMELNHFLETFTDLNPLDLRLSSFRHHPEIKLHQPWLTIVKLWDRRLQERVPLQYILGKVNWRHFSLKVSPAVLIPRPETELIIDLAYLATAPSPSLNALNPLPFSLTPSPISANLAVGHWVDLGTGSGAIALGLGEVFPKAIIHAVDISASALSIARENAQTLGYKNRINFYQGSWWSPLENLKGKVSGMVANPPYIPSQQVLDLQPEVTLHEPHQALDGGKQGLDCIRYLGETAPQYLRPGGIWIVEMMAGQGKAVTAILESVGCYHSIQIVPDLAGFDRFAIAYRQ